MDVVDLVVGRGEAGIVVIVVGVGEMTERDLPGSFLVCGSRSLSSSAFLRSIRQGEDAFEFAGLGRQLGSSSMLDML